MLLLLLAPPALAACISVLVPRGTRLVGWLSVAAAAASLFAAISLSSSIVATGSSAGIDGLSALLALCIAFVTLLASALGPGLGAADHDPAQTRRFRIFFNAFAFTMLAAVTVQ